MPRKTRQMRATITTVRKSDMLAFDVAVFSARDELVGSRRFSRCVATAYEWAKSHDGLDDMVVSLDGAPWPGTPAAQATERFAIEPCPFYPGRVVVRDTRTGELAGDGNPWRSVGAARVVCERMNSAAAEAEPVRRQPLRLVSNAADPR